MAEIKEYEVVFLGPGCCIRKIRAYDAADALVQAELMIKADSRVGHLGPLHGYHVMSISPVEPPK